MFDLFRSRAKSVRILLGGLLMLVAVSLVVTLIPGYGTGTGENTQIVAEVGKDVVSLREVQLQVQAAMRNKAFPAEMAELYIPQMVDQMITDRALAYQAEQMGFRVTEAEVAEAIRAAIPQLYQGGTFVGRQVYADLLAQQNLTIEQFENQVRQQLLFNRLRGLAAEGVIVAPEEVEGEYRIRNDKVKLEYIELSPESLRAGTTVTPEEVKTYFEANRASFQMPEKRSFDILIADEQKIGQSVEVPESEIRRAYQENQDQYRVPERVHVRHILLMTTGKPEEEKAKLQSRAEELLKQLKAGADFADLAQKNSQDPGSAAKGGDLGWIVRGQTVSAFENTAFSLKPKEISNVITTEYGFHILQLVAREEAHLTPLEEVKNQIASDLKRQKVFDTMQRLADQARTDLLKAPTEAAQIASRLGLQHVRAEDIQPGQPLPGFGGSREVLDSVAILEKGQVTPVLQANETKLGMAVLADVVPSRPAELSEVERQIRERLMNEKIRATMERRAGEILANAKAGGDLRKFASGFPVKTTQDFGITGAADGIGAASLVYQAFTEPAGGVFGPISAGNKLFICRVLSKTPADMSKLPEQREGLLAELKMRKARERDELFADSLRTHLIKEGKIKINDDVIRRLVASYRS